MRLVRRLLLLAVIAGLFWVGYSFPTQNGELVAISYLFGSFEAVPIWLVVLVAFGAGVMLTGVVSMLRITRLTLETRRYRKAVTHLESEVHQLRNLPLSPDADVVDGPHQLESSLGLERGS
jgi:uncharacterized integral membrane protein